MQAAPGILQWLQGLFSAPSSMGQMTPQPGTSRQPQVAAEPPQMMPAVAPPPQPPQLGAGMSFTPPLPADMPLREEPYDPLSSVMAAMTPPAPKPRMKPVMAAPAAKPATAKPRAKPKPTKKDLWDWRKARMRERQPY
jgi:hypothetical protein